MCFYFFLIKASAKQREKSLLDSLSFFSLTSIVQNNIKINYYVEIHYKNQKPVVIIASTLVVADHTGHIAGVF